MSKVWIKVDEKHNNKMIGAKIYLSGPMTSFIEAGKEDEAREIFEIAENNFKNLGYEVANPFKNGLDKNDKWIRHIRKDLEMLDDCNIICYLHTCELLSSPGGDMEKIAARREKKREMREIKHDNGDYEYAFIN